ncbi:MAG: hypothetical protein HFJ28_03775 [Clostridia bacterium]|nr:hypothetical protein [Clostridia bacterium]
MKQIDIRHFMLYPREFGVDGLERAYQEYKNSPPDAIAFCEDDMDNQLFRWEDVAILHFLSDRGVKVSYYWILVIRDMVLNGIRSPEEVGDTISHYFPKN